jgi:hypothetical protein
MPMSVLIDVLQDHGAVCIGILLLINYIAIIGRVWKIYPVIHIDSCGLKTCVVL